MQSGFESPTAHAWAISRKNRFARSNY